MKFAFSSDIVNLAQKHQVTNKHQSIWAVVPIPLQAGVDVHLSDWTVVPIPLQTGVDVHLSDWTVVPIPKYIVVDVQLVILVKNQ